MHLCTNVLTNWCTNAHFNVLCTMSHLDVVRSDGVEERGPAVARVPEAVKEDH